MSKIVATLEELEPLKIVENVSHTLKKQGIPNEASKWIGVVLK